jgi:hypothetical protein
MDRYVFKTVLLMLCVVFTQAFAGDVSYSASEKTPLKLKEISEYGVASFSGSITISGEYEVTLDSRFSENDKFEPYVSFYPDSNSLKYLPTPKSAEPEYDTPPNAIFLTNGYESAKLLLNKSKFKTLMNVKEEFDNYTEEQIESEAQSFKPFRGLARIRIDSYETAIDCDSRWYNARLVRVEQTSNQMVVSNSGNLPC